MSRKAIWGLLAAIVIGFTGTTAASARGGGGGDYPSAVVYPYLPSVNSERACHVVQRRMLTRNGWRLCPVRVCG